MTTSVDRFQVLSHNELKFPHRCATCASFSGDNGREFIDFGLFVEFYGSVYICTECFLGAVDSIKPRRRQMYDARVNELQAVVMTLIKENRTLRDGIDLLRAIDHPNTDTDDGNVVPTQSVEAGPDRLPEKPEASNPTPDRVTDVRESGEAGSSEQVNVEGPADVRKDDSSDSILIGLDLDALGGL